MESDRRLAAGIFIVVFLTYASFFGGAGWNQNTLFDLTRAMVERRTFAIDPYASNTYDISVHGGHTYANKPPGVSFLAVAPYALLLTAERLVVKFKLAGCGYASTRAMTVHLYVVTVAVCGVTGAMIPALLYLYLRRKLDVHRRLAVVIALVTAFGTYVFAYSTVLFTHVPSAAFLLWAFTRLSEDPEERPALAGFLAGVAGLCNYVAIPAAAIMLGLTRTRRQAVLVMAGGLPFAILLMTYHALCFGSPFRSAVEATSPVFLSPDAALGVLTGPRLEALAGILLSRRGLFYLSQILLCAVVGLVRMWRVRSVRREAAVLSAIAMLFVVVSISFNNWDGGSAIGPRYILPIVPLLAIAAAFAAGFLRPLWIALAAVSIVSNFIVTSVNPLPSRGITNPLLDYAFPLFATGRLPSDTPAHPPLAWKRMLGHVSVSRHAVDELVPFLKHAPDSAEGDWASFNLGEILWPGSVSSVLPVLMWMLMGSALLLRRAWQLERSSTS